MLFLQANLQKARKGYVGRWARSPTTDWLYCTKSEKSPWESPLKFVWQTLFFSKSTPLLCLFVVISPSKKMLFKWVSVLCSFQHALKSYLSLSVEWVLYNLLPLTTSYHKCCSGGELKCRPVCLWLWSLLTFYLNFVVAVFIFLKLLPNTLHRS